MSGAVALAAMSAALGAWNYGEKKAQWKAEKKLVDYNNQLNELNYSLSLQSINESKKASTYNFLNEMEAINKEEILNKGSLAVQSGYTGTVGNTVQMLNQVAESSAGKSRYGATKSYEYQIQQLEFNKASSYLNMMGNVQLYPTKPSLFNEILSAGISVFGMSSASKDTTDTKTTKPDTSNRIIEESGGTSSFSYTRGI